MTIDDIAALLYEANGELVSGEEMASKLGITRAAVWKHIEELKSLGYDVISKPRHGYAMAKEADLLLPCAVKNGLKTAYMGQNYLFHAAIDSTNNEAKKLARAGVAEGTVVLAEEQGAGRGRLSRAFFSPKGKGLWFSVILRPPFLPQEAPKCTLMAAAAVARAMEDINLTPGIKWPNDIIHEGKKVTGILTEMSAEMDSINYVVIGIGINVNIWPEDFPAELREIATSLTVMGGKKISRVAFLQRVLKHLENLYEDAKKRGFAPIIEEWRRHSVTLGQNVQVLGVGQNESFSGYATDIDETGALLVDTGSEVRRVLAGDVSIRSKKCGE
ncbi:MAG: biotin--[Selenomonadaceae bacterium]|nr:biotin--[acetyl-CoA-carboxylase] ligase [Selenomonadaceae bacterium]